MNVPNPYLPQENYTPTATPSVKLPQVAVPANLTEEQAQVLSPNQSAYSQSVNHLQTQVKALRELLNNPQAVSNEQLQTSLKRLVENDAGKGFLELLKFNPNLLNDLEQKGLISDSDRKNLSASLSDILNKKASLETGHQKLETLGTQIQELETQLESVTDSDARNGIQAQIEALRLETRFQQENNQQLQSEISSAIDNLTKGELQLQKGQTPEDVLGAYLNTEPSPLSEPQINAYRAGLVKSADQYLTQPNAGSYSDLRSNLYSNLYAFEKSVPAAQEQSYVKFKEAVLDVEQKYSNLNHQMEALTGTSSSLGDLKTGEELAEELKAHASAAVRAVDAFAQKGESVLAYLKAYPNQYEGQAADAAALEQKLNALKASPELQDKVSILNQISSALDEVYIKTEISKGSAPLAEETQSALLVAKDKLSSEEDKKKLDLLIKNPELVRILPKADEYSKILTYLSEKSFLTFSEQELKTALESGNTEKVNAIFTADMFSSFGFGSLALGGAFYSPSFNLDNYFMPPSLALSSMSMDSSLIPNDNELTPTGNSSFDLGLGQTFGSSNASSGAFQLTAPTIGLSNRPLSLMAAPLAPPTPLWLSVPGGSARAEALSKELASMPEDQRQQLVEALKSPEMAGMSDFLQRLSQEQPELKAQLDKVQAGENGKEAINSGHWNNDSLLDAAQSALQNQIQAHDSLKAEITLAKKDLETLIANPDLSLPVKAKLQEQLKTINGALGQINKGEFPPADSAEQQKLDKVMQAISTQGKPQGLSLSDRFMLQATVDVLDDLKATPALMQKLETAPSFKNLTQVFAKDESGSYTFPQEIQNLLKDPNLSPEAAQMLMLQANRISHLANAAATKLVDEIEAILKVGERQKAEGNGGGELTSGFDSLISLNSFKENMNAMGKTSSSGGSEIKAVTWMNTIAKKVGPLDLAHENREMRQRVNSVFMDNAGMVKDLAEENLNTIQEKAQIKESQNSLANLIKDPEMMAVMDKALAEQGLKPEDLESLDATKLAKIEKAVAAVKLKINQSPGASDNPVMKSQLEKLDNIEQVRQAVVALETKNTQATTSMLTMIENSKQEYLTGMTEMRDQLKAQGIATPQLDAFLAAPFMPNGPALSDVQGELAALSSNTSQPPQVRALANTSGQILNNVSIISMAQTEIANGEYKPETQAALIGAVGGGTQLRQFMATYRNELQTLGPEKAAENLNANLGALATRIEAAGTDPAAMTTAVSLQGGNSGSSGGGDRGLVVAMGGPMGRVVQDINNLFTAGIQMNEAGFVPPKIDLGGMNITSFNPPDRDRWYPGKFLHEMTQMMRQRGTIIAQTPPSQLAGVLGIFGRGDQISAHADNTLMKGVESYLQEINPFMQAAGLPGMDLSYINSSDPLSGDPSFSAEPQLSAEAKSLVAQADQFANAILAPTPEVSGEAFLSELLQKFLDSIRDLDFESRKLVLAQMTQKMMNNAITRLYKERADQNNQYHEKMLNELTEGFKGQIEKSIERGLMHADSAQAAMAEGAQLGSKTGEAVNLSEQQLKAHFSQLLEGPTQDNMMTRVSKQKLLQALFEGSKITGQPGIFALLNRFEN